MCWARCELAQVEPVDVERQLAEPGDHEYAYDPCQSDPVRGIPPATCGSLQLLSRRLLPFDEVEKFGSGARVAPECAEHAGRDHLSARPLDSAHLHAEVARLDDHPDTFRGEYRAQRLRDLLGELLLDLKAVREDLDQSGNLAQPDDLAF